MSNPDPTIRIPVDLTNPGQFFACCGLLELADRLWPGAEGWFEGKEFLLRFDSSSSEFLDALRCSKVTSSLSAAQMARLKELSLMAKKDREKAGLEEEKKALDAMRREAPVLFQSSFELRVDWFLDEYSGGANLKTWAGQQSAIDIASDMHASLSGLDATTFDSIPWNNARGIGLPFNFDSDLGGQGSALDIGFSLDAIAGSETTRVESTCRPALELFAFIGMQRFRPRQTADRNRFVYAAWRQPLPPSVASATACQAIRAGNVSTHAFRLFFRNKYYKSFLPASQFQGDNNE